MVAIFCFNLTFCSSQLPDGSVMLIFFILYVEEISQPYKGGRITTKKCYITIERSYIIHRFQEKYRLFLLMNEMLRIMSNSWKLLC